MSEKVDPEVTAIINLAVKSGSSVIGNRCPDGSVLATILDTGEQVQLDSTGQQIISNGLGSQTLKRKPWWVFWR